MSERKTVKEYAALYHVDFFALATICHTASRDAGWYRNPDGTPKDRNVAEMLALIHSEASEAWSGMHTGAADEHIPNRFNVEVELADFVIRVADLAGFKTLRISEVQQTMYYVEQAVSIQTTNYSGNFLFSLLHARVSDALEGFRKNSAHPVLSEFTRAEVELARSLLVVDAIAATLREKTNDVPGAIADKIEYNRNRADHKLENRANGGKAF